MNKIVKTFSGTNSKNKNDYFGKHRTKPTVFSVKHFGKCYKSGHITHHCDNSHLPAGPVEYTVEDWLDKTRDTLSATAREGATRCIASINFVSLSLNVLLGMGTSTMQLVVELFVLPPDESSSSKSPGTRSRTGGGEGSKKGL
jgi:hypothetical protein